jgi:hypothetical protein
MRSLPPLATLLVAVACRATPGPSLPADDSEDTEAPQPPVPDDTEPPVVTDTDAPADTDAPVDTGSPGATSTLTASRPVLCLDPERRRERPYTVEVLRHPAPPRPALTGGGLAVGDLDGDGDLDLVAALHDRVQAWRLDVGRRLVAAPALVVADAGDDAGLAGVSVVDADDDGDLDVLASGRGVASLLLVNDGSGRLSDGTAASGLDLPAGRPWLGHAWSDVDGDGDLDLFVAGHGTRSSSLGAPSPGEPSVLRLQASAGRFDDGSDRLPASLGAAWSTAPVFFDPDGDGDDDLFVASDLGTHVGPSRLLWNDGGTLRPDGGALGLDDALDATSASAADLDGDGIEDLVVGARGRVVVRLSGSGWADRATDVGLATTEASVDAWGADVGDLDQDGLPDVAVAFGPDALAGSPGPAEQPDRVLLGDAGGLFVDRSSELGVGSRAPHRNLLVADLDRDGWLDLVAVGLDGSTKVAFAQCGEGSWVTVRLRQPAPNRYAVGATVLARVGDRTWTARIRAGGHGFGAGRPPEVHLAFGDAPYLDELVVRWPDGTVERWRNVLARRHLAISR